MQDFAKARGEGASPRGEGWAQGTGDLSRIGYTLGGTRAGLGVLFVLPPRTHLGGELRDRNVLPKERYFKNASKILFARIAFAASERTPVCAPAGPRVSDELPTIPAAMSSAALLADAWARSRK